MRKYNISSITNDMHQPQHNLTEQLIQFCKKGTKNIIEKTGATRYAWLYAILI